MWIVMNSSEASFLANIFTVSKIVPRNEWHEINNKFLNKTFIPDRPDTIAASYDRHWHTFAFLMPFRLPVCASLSSLRWHRLVFILLFRRLSPCRLEPKRQKRHRKMFYERSQNETKKKEDEERWEITWRMEGGGETYIMCLPLLPVDWLPTVTTLSYILSQCICLGRSEVLIV